MKVLVNRQPRPDLKFWSAEKNSKPLAAEEGKSPLLSSTATAI